jgi:sigma-B regulation protein RsbU (phosphoserine phosphatase)
MVAPAAQAPAQPTMQCMEVWGGNRASDNGVIMPGLDAWVFSRPYEGDDAGGDIHYVSSCATGRITRILVADVSGHGHQVARVAAFLRTLMRRFVNYIDQSHLVRALNVEFAGLADTGSFATAIVATFWAPTDELVITNAGHPRPLRYRARTRTWEALENRAGPKLEGLTNIPLGIAEPASYDELTIRLAPGDLVLIYTDSLLEARGPAGQLGDAGLLRLLGTLDAAAPESLIPGLLAAVESFAGGPPADDVTVMLLRPNALKPRMNFGSGLRAAALMVRTFFASLRPSAEPFPWPQVRVDNIVGAFLARMNRRLGRGKSPD